MASKSEQAAAIIDALTAAYDGMVTFTLFSTPRSMKDAGIAPPRNNAVIIRSEFAGRTFDTPIARRLIRRNGFTDVIITTVSTHLRDALMAIYIEAELQRRGSVTAHD